MFFQFDISGFSSDQKDLVLLSSVVPLFLVPLWNLKTWTFYSPKKFWHFSYYNPLWFFFMRFLLPSQPPFFSLILSARSVQCRCHPAKHWAPRTSYNFLHFFFLSFLILFSSFSLSFSFAYSWIQWLSALKQVTFRLSRRKETLQDNEMWHFVWQGSHQNYGIQTCPCLAFLNGKGWV